MDIQEIFYNFANECWENLNLRGIIQFGSSTYSKNSQDIDLLFFSKEGVVPSEDFLKLMKIMKNFESKYPEIALNFSSWSSKANLSACLTSSTNIS